MMESVAGKGRNRHSLHRPVFFRQNIKYLIYMKILIIDDERSIRNSLKEILADEGYDVEVAENGITR